MPATPRNPEPLLQRLADAFRRGRLAETRRGLHALARDRVPAGFRVPAADLARRAGAPQIAIRLLRKAVRPSARARTQAATPAEKAQYAAALAALGAYGESDQLFAEVDPDAYPHALFLRAVSLFPRAEYARAIPLLERFLARGAPDQEHRLMAQIRLLASYLRTDGREQKAAALAGEVLAAADPARHPNHFQRVRILNAERLYFARGDRPAALAELLALEREFPGHENIYLQFWKCIFSLPPGRATEARRRLRPVKAAAARQWDWLALRSFDLYEASILKDRALFAYAYFGTPFPAFRQQLRARFGGAPELPETYLWKLGGEGADAVTLDVRNGTNDRGDRHLKEGQLLQRLLEILASDFYRPLPIPEIHEKLYPGEHYHAELSTNRVHVAVIRLRAWLAAARIPLTVRSRDGFYRLGASAPCRLRVPSPDAGPRPSALPVRLEQWLDRLGQAFGPREFSSSEAAARLQVTPRTVLNHLKTARAHGRVDSRGKGPAQRYRLISRTSGAG